MLRVTKMVSLDYAKATSKTAQLLKIIYELSDVNEMKNLVKFDFILKTLNTHTLLMYCFVNVSNLLLNNKLNNYSIYIYIYI
jgi:hypothetical protein